MLSQAIRPEVLTPGPGEPQGVLAFVVTQHLIAQLKQLISQLTHLAWFLESGLVADIKVKTKHMMQLSRARSENHWFQTMGITIP